MIGAALIAASFAWAGSPLPAFNGDMTFPTIREATDSEEFSWEVMLGKGQELKQIDDGLAWVFYPGTEDVAYAIVAEPAHDAEGANVPTSLVVSEGNVLTFIVHHRDGNPARAGASFRYPVNPGAGWEGGFTTTQVDMSPADRIESDAKPLGCVLPALKGKSLKAARKRLRRSGCELGRVGGRRSKSARVVRQNPPPGEMLAPGAKVSLTLAQSGMAKA